MSLFWPTAAMECCCDEEPGCGVVTGTAHYCCDIYPLAGATATLRLLDGLGGSTPVATTTTATDGTYSLAVPAAGPYDVLLEHPGFTPEVHNLSGPYGINVVCGDPGPYTADGLPLQADGVDWVCTCVDCGPDDGGPCVGTGVSLLPATLYLSDGTETITLGAGNNGWQGCIVRSLTGRAVEGPEGAHPGACTGGDVTVDIPIFFSLNCTNGGEFTLTVQAPCCDGYQFNQAPYAARGSCGGTSGFLCAVVATGVPTSCSPLAVTLEANDFGTMRDVYEVGHIFTLSE